MLCCADDTLKLDSRWRAESYTTASGRCKTVRLLQLPSQLFCLPHAALYLFCCWRRDWSAGAYADLSAAVAEVLAVLILVMPCRDT